MAEKEKGNPIGDAIPDWGWALIAAVSGCILGYGISQASPELRVAIQHWRNTLIGLSLCLVLIFAFARRRFPAFGNVVMWVAGICIGLIRW